jgi:hypothetical protein
MPTNNYHVDNSIEVPASMVTRPPFAKINLWREKGNTHVLCYMALGDRGLEETTTGVAIDASGSMQELFGLGPFARNQVRDVAQLMCSYIASRADRDGGTTLIYWATGDPSEIEPHGFLSESEAKSYQYPRPKLYGRRTNLLPALKYFIEGNHPQSGRPFRDTKLGLFVFITDGAIDDLEAVKQYSTGLAQEIQAGKRNPVKLVLIGFGKAIDEQQMQELDDLDTGTDQDLYFHRIADQMADLGDIFIELVNENMTIADNGAVRDDGGKEVLSFRDTKVPARFEFDLPAGARGFSFEVEGQGFSQQLP